jgi:4-hydroxy-tetrahydrodipicolinate reductase
MKIALIGYGKMGKAIEQILLERNHEVVLRISSSNLDEFRTDNLKKADAAIEFTNPHSAVANLYRCFEAGIPVVTGSTGWLQQLPEVTAKMQEHNGTLFYAPNFSVGVNIFFHINEVLAKLMNSQADYNVEMEEIHHTQKLDSPSGTAIKTAEIILSQLERKGNWAEDSARNDDDLIIHVKREEGVPGTHEVKYVSEIDEISLKHTAFSRKGFALGAVLAAEWVSGKKGVFEMKDMLRF